MEPNQVEIVPGANKPTCAYRVIGAAFASGSDAGLEKLRSVAASAGGDGIYDSNCKTWRADYAFHSQYEAACVARVFVCAKE